MKRLATIIAAIALSGLPAFAADMPVKAPPPPPAPVDSWTGFYVGAELGGEWADTTWTTTSGSQPNFVAPGVPLTFAIDASSPRNYHPSAARFGGYLGYNWQFASQWVAGAEVDGAYANNTHTVAGVPGCSIQCEPFITGSGVDTSSVKMGSDASVRVRLGYLVLPNLMAYGTGGIVLQHFETSVTCQFSGADPICFDQPGHPFATATNSTNRTGWTIGGGLEARIYGNWLLRAEYRYSDFGTWSNSFALNVPGSGVPTLLNTQLRITTQIATVGFAYKF